MKKNPLDRSEPCSGTQILECQVLDKGWAFSCKRQTASPHRGREGALFCLYHVCNRGCKGAYLGLHLPLECCQAVKAHPPFPSEVEVMFTV